MKKGNWIFILTLLFVAGLTRLLPHPPNFTALGAMALFGGAALNNKVLRVALPLIVLFLTDIVINNTIYYNPEEGFALFYAGAAWTYLAIAGIAFFSSSIVNRLSVSRVALGSAVGSVLFFVVSNFGVWTTGIMYPLTTEGLISCYLAAVPFFGNTLAGDFFFNAILFGGLYFADIKFPKLVRVDK